MTRVSPKAAAAAASAPTTAAPATTAPVADAQAERPDRPTEDAPAAESEKKQGRPKQNKVEFFTEGMEKLAAWPADFDPRKHKPLVVENFSAEDVFWNKKAADYDKRAADCRTKAGLFTKFGSAEKRKSAEKIGKLAGQLELLKAAMTTSGDLTEAEVNELINAAAASVAAPAAEAAAVEAPVEAPVA